MTATVAESRKFRNEARVAFEQAQAKLKKANNVQRDAQDHMDAARKRFEDKSRLYEEALQREKERKGAAGDQRFFDAAAAIVGERGYDWGVEWYVCLRKVLHLTYAEALEAVRMSGRDDMSPYVCIYCTGWHVGHAPKFSDGLTPSKNKIAARMAEKLKRGWKI